MKKAYLSPKLVSVSFGYEDTILASTINDTTICIGDKDWGVKDEL